MDVLCDVSDRIHALRAEIRQKESDARDWLHIYFRTRPYAVAIFDPNRN